MAINTVDLAFTLIWFGMVLLFLFLILSPAWIHRSDVLSTLVRMKFMAGLVWLPMAWYSGLRVVRISACRWSSVEVNWYAQRFGETLRWRYLLWVGGTPLVPCRAGFTPSRSGGTKALDLAEVGQYGTGAAIHTIKGIAGVWLPMGLEKLAGK